MRLAILLSFVAVTAFSQDTLRTIPTDTIDVQRTVAFTPDGARRPIRSLPYYVVPVVDPRLREASMGMSVLNTLRGQVPGLFISPQFVTGSPFDLSTFMVIDGAPVNSKMADFSSMNTFDYGGPTVVTGNATTYYGMYGSDNGVLLKSLSGEGFDRGAFSFNTFNTMGRWSDGQESYGQVRTSNSLAYSKDFGAVDVRVSGNYTYTPGFTEAFNALLEDTRIKNANLKINTGWNISRKLSARLILERNDEQRHSEIQRFVINPSDKLNYGNNSSRANLNLDYSVTSWLRFSSRLQKSSVENDYRSYPFVPVTVYKQSRNFFNLFANFDKSITKNVALSASTGIQTDRATGSVPYYVNSHMTNVGFRFKDQLFVDGSFRIDKSDIDPSKNTKKTWSVGTGWIFSDLLGANNGFPYGKLRASVGHYTYTTIPYYPQVALTTNQYFPEQTIDNSKQYFRYDVGADLSFLRGRLQVTANYLRLLDATPNAQQQSRVGPVTVFFDDHTRYFTDQQQLAIGGYLTNNKAVLTRLTLTTTQSKKRTASDNVQTMNDGHPYFLDLLQTATIEGVILNLLIEGYSFGSGDPIWGVRQLSIGYPVAKGLARRRSVDPAVVSVILRNFMGNDESAYVTNGFARSVSVGYTMNF